MRPLSIFAGHGVNRRLKYPYRLFFSHFTAPAQRSLLCHISQKMTAAVMLHMISLPARQAAHETALPLIAMLCGSSLLQRKKLQAAVSRAVSR